MPSALWTRAQDGGVAFKVRAAPGASRERVIGLHGDALKVAVTAPPERGRANRRIIAVLAKALGVSAGSFRLIAGETSRDKLLHVAAFDELRLRAALAAILD